LEFLSPVNTNSANFAGNPVSCHSVSFSNREWIIDSGASDHMTSSFSPLDNTQLLNQPCPISLPNGDIVSITHTGTLRISPAISLPNVLYVPSFKFNLLSISKITSTLNCVAIFFSDFCVFQDLSTRKLIGTGEVRDGLYHYKPFYASVFHSQCISDSTLWHQRLGHPSTSSIPATLNFPKLHLPCDVCARAKHTRLPFLLNTN
jgi:hypothetical protein